MKIRITAAWFAMAICAGVEAGEIELIKAQANRGDATSQASLAEAYYYGQGVRKNYDSSFKWSERAEAQGNPMGQYRLGTLLHAGKGCQENKQRATKLFKIAFPGLMKLAQQKLTQPANNHAQCMLGVIFDYGLGCQPDLRQAEEWYHLSALQGNVNAQFYLGLLHDADNKLLPNDAKAEIWYRKAAQQGHAKAQFFLGLMLNSGRGAPANQMEAEDWCRRAAEAGLLDAQLHLGQWSRLHGNPKESAKWYRQAALNNSPVAQLRMGNLHEKGTGVLLDDAMAYAWFNIAALSAVTPQDRKKAEAARDRIREGKPITFVLDGQRLSRELIKQMDRIGQSTPSSEDPAFQGETPSNP
jgi:TPR repeat protein